MRTTYAAIAAMALACSPSLEAAFTSQVIIAPAPGGAVSITDSTSNTVHFRVGDNGGVEVVQGLSVGGTVSASRFASQYDSGWFYVTSASGDITVNHTLGDVPAFFTVQQCGKLSPDPGGTQPTVVSPSTGTCATRTVIAMSSGYQSGGTNINPVNIAVDATSFLVPISNAWWVWGYYTNAGGWGCPGDADASCFTGYYRIRAWR